MAVRIRIVLIALTVGIFAAQPESTDAQSSTPHGFKNIIVHSGDCGSCSPQGDNVTLRNTDRHNGYTVTVRISYRYNGKPHQQDKLFKIAAGQEILLGCTCPGPTSQRFSYEVVGESLAVK